MDDMSLKILSGMLTILPSHRFKYAIVIEEKTYLCRTSREEIQKKEILLYYKKCLT